MSDRFPRYCVAALAALLPATAFAADKPIKAPIYKAEPVPIFTWNGLYVGANVGLSVGHDPTSATGAYALGIGGAPVTLYDERNTTAPLGIIAGGQIGYNWQFSPSYVLGLEADWQWSGEKDSACVFTCGSTTTTFFGPGGAGFNNKLEMEHRLVWFGTARARAGTIIGNSLWYATGGLAWGRLENNVSLTSTNVVAALFNPGTVTSNVTHDKIGWSAGAGVETSLGGAWSIKAEYLYVDLGSETDTFTIAGGPGVPGSTFTTTTSYTITDHIFRAGLNYKFGS